MNRDALRIKLEQLRTELAGAANLDVKTHDQLRALVADIERSIEGEETEGGPLGEQVDDLVLKFEADHPQITSALNQVATALSNLGI